MAAPSTAFYSAAVVAVVLVAVVGEAASDGSAAAGVKEILKNNGLPEGLLPGTVKSYSLSENGKFEVQLASTCTAKIGSEEVYYKKTITGELSFGQIKNLAGIQAHVLFWVSVTGIEVDKNDPGTIWFYVGFLSRSMETGLFSVSPSCNSLSEQQQSRDMTFAEWFARALSGTLEVNVPTIVRAGANRRMLQ